MTTQRIGIVSISMSLLDQWMHLPAGTRVTDVRRCEDTPFGTFEVLVEGDAIPETAADQLTPRLICSVIQIEPRAEFSLTQSR